MTTGLAVIGGFVIGIEIVAQERPHQICATVPDCSSATAAGREVGGGKWGATKAYPEEQRSGDE